MHRTLITFLTLAFVGAALASMSLYVQFVTMDLQRFTLSEYLQKDITLFVWWEAVAIPLLMGVGYIVVAIAGIRAQPGPRSMALILVGCFALAVLLCFANLGLGIMSSISLLALAFGPVRAVLTQRRTNEPGAT